MPKPPADRPARKSGPRPPARRAGAPAAGKTGGRSARPEEAAGPRPPAPPAGRAAGRPPERPAPAARTPRAAVESGLRVKWLGFRTMYDYWGRELPRFYQLETLSNAVTYYLRTRDQFMMPAFHEALGPSPIVSVEIALFQEGRFQLIFRVAAANAQRRRAAWALVVAKNHKECSEVARAEHRLLHVLHRRAPQDVVQPFGCGTFYLPDRHGRREHGREIFAYLTQWLEGYEELGIHKNLQLLVNVAPHHLFTRDQTEHLKAEMVRIAARTFDADEESAMALPEIASGDFVVRRGPRGKLGLKLIACRAMQERVRPPRLIDRMLDASWDWGGRRYRFAPASPEAFVEALAAARGTEQARAWVRAYLEAVRAGRLPHRQPDFLDGLRGLVVQ